MFQTLSTITNARFIANTLLLKRYFTYDQATNALRPFFFAVHPDFFANTPRVGAVNEDSLKTLNGYLESVSQGHIVKPKMVTFYLRSTKQTLDVKPVTFYLKRRDLHTTVVDILTSCRLSTSHVLSPNQTQTPKYEEETKLDSSDDVKQHTEVWDSFIKRHSLYSTQEESSSSKTNLVSWLNKSVNSAQKIVCANIPLIKETEYLIIKLKLELYLSDIIWGSDWGFACYRSCLASFDRLICDSVSLRIRHLLQNRRLVFTRRSGISVMGDILLSCADVPESWVNVLNKAESQFKVLNTRIPALERGISLLLNGAKINRLTPQNSLFLVDDYERQLKRLLAALSSNLRHSNSRLNENDLSSIEIALDDAVDNPSLSADGVILLPACNPPFLLIDFINDTVEHNYCQQRRTDYALQMSQWDKVRNDCLAGLQVASLQLDSNVSIAQGIACCQAILGDPVSSGIGSVGLQGCDLKISKFYSISGDGVLCIPWDWNVQR